MFQVNPLLALFSSKDKSKKYKCCLLQFLFGALRVNINWTNIFRRKIHEKRSFCTAKAPHILQRKISVFAYK